MNKKFYAVILPILMILQACGSDDGGAARIVVGTSSVIVDLNVLQYQKPYVIQVTDIDGNAAPNTRVTITMKNLFYALGSYTQTADAWTILGVNYTACAAEDVNNNGVMDAGEDRNANGVLDPTNAASIGAHPTLTPTFEAGFNSIITDELGFAYFSLTYPKSEANWNIVEISVFAEVSGTENVEKLAITLPVALVDLTDITIDPPGGEDSSYGTGACPP